MSNRPRRILVVLGTRPEVIKLAPLIRELRSRSSTFEVRVCATGQHRQLLDTALAGFGLVPDIDLQLMREAQSPADLLARAIAELAPVIERTEPDAVIVQGDTTSAFAGALASYYARVPLAHVEAGLRSGDPLAPFPEEQHRRMIDQLSRWLFAPTETARHNLLREGHAHEWIWVTGNTGVDALRWMQRLANDPAAIGRFEAMLRARGLDGEASGRKLVVATLHRREQLAGPLTDICAALATLANSPGIDVVLPVHPNPEIRAVLEQVLADTRVHRLPALDPVDFIALIQRAALIITDSGGVQEEAATLGVPALIVRSRSDRPESVAKAGSRVVGHDAATIIAAAFGVIDGPPSRAGSEVFGDGRSAVRIADVLALTDA
jgi:UDP-N-acetylglucosamine 2-epimerase (non-hydrolysing)